MNMPLYKLKDQYLAIQDLDLHDDVIADTLEGLTGEIEIKAENIIYVLTNMDTSPIETEIKRLQDMKRMITNRKENLKDYLRRNMEDCEINKITWATGSVTLRKPIQVVQIDDMDELPAKYQRISVAADKKAIKDALKDGGEVAGCRMVSGKAGILIK